MGYFAQPLRRHKGSFLLRLLTMDAAGNPEKSFLVAEPSAAVGSEKIIRLAGIIT